jgi:methyl-accepting chemotaxis protein
MKCPSTFFGGCTHAKLSLPTKLAVGFGVPLLALAIVGTMGIYCIRQLSLFSAGIEQKAGSISCIRSAWDRINMRKVDVRSLLLSADEKYMRDYEEQNRLLNEKFSELEKRLTTDKARKMLAHFRDGADAYDRVSQHVAEVQRAGKKAEAVDQLFTAVTDALRADMERTYTDLIEFGESLNASAREQQIATESRVTILIVFFMLAGLAAGVGMAIYIARNITGRVSQIVAMIEAISDNDLSREDMTIRNRDEIGTAGILLNGMKNNLNKMIQSIAETAQQVASASEQLSSVSPQITSNSEETSAQASVVTQATKQVSENLQSVSSGAEEMTSTIQSIASNAHEAATVASKAVETAQAANTTVGKLGESSAEIGAVIKVITSIAQQTNLLALNATIEAARAGEAGKGFAVVANEVKELAKQTAKATEDISQKITAIQQDTKGAVDTIGSITGVITQVNEISGTIATAVEEQSATTNEMTRNVADAAKGPGEISHNIEGVAQAAQGTSNSAQESQKAANELAQMAQQLRGLVGQFKIDRQQADANPVLTMKARAVAGGAGK